MPKKSRRHRAAVQRRTAVQAQPRPAATPAEPSAATATVSPPVDTVPATATARPAARPRTSGGARSGTPSGSRPLYDYRYTLLEARRIGILATALFVILAILGFILR